MEGEPVDPETDSSLVQAFHLNSRNGATGKGLVTDATDCERLPIMKFNEYWSNSNLLCNVKDNVLNVTFY
jgi:hypothetical protein